jgi:2,5-diamino-6-(ribosylamino)-4(3H)-pyrimidinone 5'-phosphate reductase
MTRPFVVVHNVMSVDGRVDGFTPDIGQYYDAAAALEADCMLTGSDTILKAIETEGIAPDRDAPKEPSAVDPDDERPLLVIADSKGRINVWQALRDAGYWRDMMALVSHSTPSKYIEYLKKSHVPYIVAGTDRIDFGKALDVLGRRGIKRVRTDSGGTLNGMLLCQGLVDEVSVLVHPALVGGTTSASIYRAPDLSPGDRAISLQIISSRRLRNGVVWLRYKVTFDTAETKIFK